MPIGPGFSPENLGLRLGAPVEIRFDASIPEEWAGLPVHGRFRLGGEALLFVNGQPIGGLNPLHAEYPLLIQAKGGERLQFQAQVVPHGLFGTPVVEPRFDLACLLVPEDDCPCPSRRSCCRSGCGPLSCRYGSGSHCGMPGRRDPHAFRAIILPRSDTEEYLSRIAAAAENRSADDFYGNQERLGSLWERWKFRLPSGLLTREQRSRLCEVREGFAAELGFDSRPFPGRRKCLADWPRAH